MKKSIKTFLFLVMAGIAMHAQEAPNEPLGFQKDFKHSISACPVAVVFGIYSINYEYLHNQKHGMVARFDYEAIPKTYTNANIESSGYSFLLNYRYHFNNRMKSFFVGAYARYRQFEGEGMIDDTPFEFTMPDISYGFNAGKKWVWKSGFNLTFALGYGISHEDWDTTPSSGAINGAIRDYRDAYDFIDPFYGEFSIGFSF